jgi:hypothetical protein
VTKIQVETKQLTQKNVSAEEIYKKTLNGTDIVIFDSPKYNLTISGGTIVDSNINYAIISGTGSQVTLSGKSYEEITITTEKSNSYTVSTDIENIETYETTLTCNNINILDYLKFIEYTIKSQFVMSNTKIGDIIDLDTATCRVMQLNYDLKQTTIYAEAELVQYYAENENSLATENNEIITTENNEDLEVE